MDAIDRYGDNGYWSLDGAIKQVMRRSAGDAVLLGYLLRRMMDEKLWAGQYSSLDGYLREELHMDYTMACRFEAINRKYSIGGHSKDIDEKYEGFSQGVLIEMLNMPPELMEKVTPDMTVRQVREAKRQARQGKLKEGQEPTGEALPDKEAEASQPQKEPEEQLPGQMDVEDFPELLPESGHGEMAEGQDGIPDAEYRELEPVEEVATSQLDGTAPEPELVETAVPQEAEDGGAPGKEPDSRDAEGLAEAKRVLAKKQKMLDDFLKASAEDGSVLESQMFRHLAIIVDALTAMVRSMEEAEARKDGPEEREQPPLPSLRNNDQRREWLKSYKDWGLWYRDDNIGMDYYKYDFNNGARLIVEAYHEEGTKCHGFCESGLLHLVGGPKPPMGQYGSGKWQRHERYSRYPNSETELVEFLKELQKKG